MKKTITFIITGFVLIGSVFAGTTQEIEYFIAANDLAEKWIITKKTNNQDYNVLEWVLRQEIAVISRRVSGIWENTGCKNIFWDVSANIPNDWVCKNVEALVENNFISKNDNFRPEDNISKAEALIMLIRSIGFDFTLDSNSTVSWQKQVVDYSVTKWVVKDFSDFGVEATRWWIFEVANYSIEIKQKEDMKKQEKQQKNISGEAL